MKYLIAIIMLLSLNISADYAEEAQEKYGRPRANGKILDVGNSDKIVFYGVSSTRDTYTVSGKSWISKISQQTNYQCLNQGRSCNTYDEYAFNIRDGNLEGCARGITLRDLHPTYIFLVSSIVNPGWEGWGGQEYWNSTLVMNSIRNAVQAVRSMGARPVFGTDQVMCNNVMFDSILYDYSKRNRIPYWGIGTNGENILDYKQCRHYWAGAHTGTRTNSYHVTAWLYGINQLPPPLKSLKIFRKRSAFPLKEDINRLNYDSIDDREKKFQEISLGESCLSKETWKNYDRLDEEYKTGFIEPNEYSTLIAGEKCVPFAPDSKGDAVGLFDFTIDETRPESAVIYIKSPENKLQFYLKNNLARPGLLKLVRGVVFDVSKEVFDKLDDSYVGKEYTSDQVTLNSKGRLIYKGKYYDYNTGYLACFDTNQNHQGTKWRNKEKSVLKATDGGIDIPHLGVVNLRKDHQFFYSLRHGFGAFEKVSAQKDPQGYWKITIAKDDISKYFSFDNLKLLVKSNKMFSVADVFMEYSGGTPKGRNNVYEFIPKRQYTEKIPVNTFSEKLEESGWKILQDTGTVKLVSIPVEFRNYPTRYAPAINYKNLLWHCELGVGKDDKPSVISRTIKLNKSGLGYRRLLIRALCRVFPKNYISKDEWKPDKKYLFGNVVYHNGKYYKDINGKPYPKKFTGNLNQEPGPDSKYWRELDSNYITDQPVITEDSYDLGTLCVGLKTPRKKSWKLIKRKVRIGWSEIYIETWLPPFVKDFEISLFKDPYDFVDENYQNHKFPLQVFFTSVQIEGE